jgi:hypothetical protein
MESTSIAGMIQMSEQAYELLSDKYGYFACEHRGTIQVKASVLFAIRLLINIYSCFTNKSSKSLSYR